MRLIWSLFLFISPSLGFSQISASSSRPANSSSAKSLQWFAPIPESTGSSSRSATLLEENRQRIQDLLYSGSTANKGLGSLASLQLKGSAEEQKQAVLAMLETTVARDSHAFNDFAQWAQSQGIRHPQETQLRQVSQNMDRKTLDVQIQLAQKLPANVRAEVIASALENGLEVTQPLIISKILEQKNNLSPSRYAFLLKSGLENAGHLYDSERDLPTIEKAIHELESAPGADLASLSCSIWNGLQQYDNPSGAPISSEADLNVSPEAQKLRATLLKPLMEMQKNKTACKEIPDLKKRVNALTQQNALTLDDSRSLLHPEKGDASQTRSAGATSIAQCQLKDIQSGLSDRLNDMAATETKQPSNFMSTTSRRCNIQILTSRTRSGFQSQISLWNSNGQKLADLKKDFKSREELVDFVIKGKYPAPPKSKTLVLTNVPDLPPTGTGKSAVGER